MGNVFTDHLDVCPQCAQNPLDLCEDGRQFLREAVDADPAANALKPVTRMLTCNACGHQQVALAGDVHFGCGGVFL